MMTMVIVMISHFLVRLVAGFSFSVAGFIVREGIWVWENSTILRLGGFIIPQ